MNYLRSTWSWVSPMQTCTFCRRRNRWSRRRRKQIHEASDWNRIVCLWPQHCTTRFVCRFYISLWAFTRRQRNNVSDYMPVAEHVNAAQLNQIPVSVCVQMHTRDPFVVKRNERTQAHKVTCASSSIITFNWAVAVVYGVRPSSVIRKAVSN